MSRASGFYRLTICSYGLDWIGPKNGNCEKNGVKVLRYIGGVAACSASFVRIEGEVVEDMYDDGDNIKETAFGMKFDSVEEALTF